MLGGIKQEIQFALQQPRSDWLPAILRMLMRSIISPLFLISVAAAQSVQPIESEPQLASLLCRNVKDEQTNELLLDKNVQLVNVTCWNALLDCASSSQHEQSPAMSLEVYKLTLRVADRLNRPELMATTYYYLGRTYSLMNDLDDAIQAYEMSRKLFEQTGKQSNLSYALADLGALYFVNADY